MTTDNPSHDKLFICFTTLPTYRLRGTLTVRPAMFCNRPEILFRELRSSTSAIIHFTD